MKKKIASVIQLLVLTLVVSSFAAVQGGTKRYDISYVDADFQTVFYGISKLIGEDILLSPEVQGKLSISLTQKTWAEMMTIICDLYELTWLVENSYISVQKTDSYQRKIISSAERREQSDATAPLVRRSFHIKHASASEMAEILNSIKSARARISVVPRNNAIIVYDTEKRLEQMQNSLAELDIETQQIVITAKLLAVDNTLANELGINWTDMQVNGSRLQADFNNVTMTPQSIGTSLKVSAFNNNVQATINNLLTDSRTEVLATPQISTTDHTEARINIGETRFVQVNDGNGTYSNSQVDVGITLTVTPHISGDNRIFLELHSTNDEVTGYDPRGNPEITKREAKTKVVVADGETVVIGGLTKNTEREAEVGIPFLKDIPVLGHLFKNTKKEMIKTDLIIFITPRIVHNYLSNVATAAKSAPVATAAEEDSDYYDEE